MEKEYNCFNCHYALEYNDGSIGCDRTFFEDGRICDIEKPELYCPVNSNINLEDSRYGGNRFIFGADDACQICHRIVYDNDWYDHKKVFKTIYKNSFDEFVEDKEVEKLRICSICNEKFNIKEDSEK